MAVKHLRLIREAKGVYASRLLNMSIKFAFNIWKKNQRERGRKRDGHENCEFWIESV